MVLIIEDDQEYIRLIAKSLGKIMAEKADIEVQVVTDIIELQQLLDRNGILNIIVVCDYDLGGGKTALDVIGMLQEFRVNVKLFVLHSDRQRCDPVLAEVFRAMMSWETNTAFIQKADYPMSKLVGLVHEHI